MSMTLDDLVRETLIEKNRRLRQAKCKHEEIYSSTVMGPNGTFTNGFCLDCGKQLAANSGLRSFHYDRRGLQSLRRE